MLNEKIIELQLRVPPGRTCTPINGYFHDKTKISKKKILVDYYLQLKSELESWRTSMVSRTSSRTHFELLGLGLKASSPRKLLCPRLEDSTFFRTVEILLENVRKLAENLRRTFLCPPIGDHVNKFFKDLFLWITPAPLSLVLGLGLEHFYSWPRVGLSSEGLLLASDFFSCPRPWPRALCVLGSTFD